MYADRDGVCKVPVELAVDTLIACQEIRQQENGIFASVLTPAVFANPRESNPKDLHDPPKFVTGHVLNKKD